jgi:hypothetical protein
MVALRSHQMMWEQGGEARGASDAIVRVHDGCFVFVHNGENFPLL